MKAALQLDLSQMQQLQERLSELEVKHAELVAQHAAGFDAVDMIWDAKPAILQRGCPPLSVYWHCIQSCPGQQAPFTS